MSDVRLKIRHVKRGGDTKLDLSNMGLTEIPSDVFSLTTLESLDISSNSIRSLAGISSLTKLKNLYAHKNKISSLPSEMLEISGLENLKLEGNSVAVMNSDLSVVFGITSVRQALREYFNSDKDSPAGDSSKPSFLTSSNLNDASYLRKKIADLQMEVAELKGGSAGAGKQSLEEQKNWMSTNKPSYGARPQTASSQMKKVKDLEDDLKRERQDNKLLRSEVTLLNNEISKSKILTSAAGEEGTIGVVSGVMEIPYEELEMDDQIGQGGFSVIKVGKWRSTDVAIKIIVDPVITDDLIAEVRNEVQMLSIIRHPKIVMLMGMCSKTSNLAIVFEYLPKGCLFDVLHTTPTDISQEQRLKIAYDIAGIFSFLHQSGVVHRDLKSYNILVDNDLNIKL